MVIDVPETGSIFGATAEIVNSPKPTNTSKLQRTTNMGDLMKMRMAGVAVVSGCAAVLAMVGCSSPQPQAAATPDPSIQEAPTSSAPVFETSAAPVENGPTETPETAPGLGTTGGFPVMDVDGYEMTVSYNVVAAEGFVSDPTNAKPKETDFVLDSTVDFQARNDTEGREIPGNDLYMMSFAAYGAGSKLCSNDYMVTNSFFGNDINKLTIGGKAYCFASLGPGYGLLSAVPVGSFAELDRTGPVGNAVRGVKESANLGKLLNQPIFTGVMMSSETWSSEAGCEGTVERLDGTPSQMVRVHTGSSTEYCG